MKSSFAILFLSTACVLFAAPQSTDILKQIDDTGRYAPMFPFQIDLYRGANLTDVRTWPGFAAKPAGTEGFINARDGKLRDASGTPRRFLGTNICFSGCFPEKEEADRLAPALARFGINSVRLHYVHHVLPKQGIYPEKDSFLEPVQLDKYDYLFAKLKEQGIYTYFQLNIARKFGAANGFENATKLPWYNNGLDNFEPRMIELHKKYVSDILNHVNPYTGIAYKDDPAIVNLEIANENSIVHAWFSEKYNLENLVEPYATQLRALWNEWLAKKYSSTAALKEAWQIDKQTAIGPELIPEGIIVTDVKNAADTQWGFQQDGNSVSSWEILPATPEDHLQGSRFARLTVQKTGITPNIPQFYRTGFKFKKGQLYTLSLKLRVDKNAPVSIRFSQDHNPWHVAGCRTTVSATPQWQSFTFPFGSSMDDDKVRLVLANFTPGVIDVADISLHEGATTTWNGQTSLEARNLDIVRSRDWSLLPRSAEDFTAFLCHLEENYFMQLYTHLKENVKAKQPVTGTQLNYGLNLVQSRTDYCDNHSYWNHPIFPGTAWDSKKWCLRNIALSNAEPPATNLNTLARSRILGKPYTVSEYDHPNTNLYAAEGNLMLAATAAFQDWDGIYQFAWTHSRDYDRKVLSGMFDLCSATVKLAHFPACYALFVRGDLQAADRTLTYAVESTQEQEISRIAEKRTPHTLSYSYQLKDSLPLCVYSGTRVNETSSQAPKGQKFIHDIKELPETMQRAFEKKSIRNSQIVWDWQEKDAGFFQVDTPNTKVFSGFVKGRGFNFKGLTLKPGDNRLDWLTLSLTNTTPQSQSNTDKLPSGKYLLAATGLCHNTGAVYVDMKNQSRISPAPAYGGNPGKAPILCEGINATLSFNLPADGLEIYALDNSGSRMRKLPVNGTENASVTLSPAYQTIWYEVVVK